VQAKRGASKYLWPFVSKSGEGKNHTLEGRELSETDTTAGGDATPDDMTVDTSRPSSRQGNFAGSSKDSKEEKDEKDEKGKDKKAAKHRRGNSIMDLFKFKVRRTDAACSHIGECLLPRVSVAQTECLLLSLSCRTAQHVEPTTAVALNTTITGGTGA
jgi:hypothetical protein